MKTASVEEIKGIAEQIKAAIPKKNIYDKAIWSAILKLIEDSDYGQKSAQVEMEIPQSPRFNMTDYMLDGGDDGVFMEVLNILGTIFNGHGQVQVAPYSQGLGTRTATLVFSIGGSGRVVAL